jgi:hypothetical protein
MRRLFLFIAVLVLGITACSSNPATTGKDKTTKEHVPNEPCHPGCFPSSTMIATQEGPRAIETIGLGDLVTLVDADGTPTNGKVNARYQTCNRLVEVQTELGNLLTTETQPLCLRDGGFRAAGQLVEGDQIWRWVEGKRRSTRVLSVVPTGREAPVFNLVVGESAVFIAGEFLARGKPPPVGGESPSGAE